MPETKPSTHLSEGIARQEQSDLSAEPTFDPGTGVKHDYQVQHTNIFTTVLSLLAIPGIWFCFLSFLLKRIAFSSENLIYQYTSEVLRQRLDQVVWIRVALGLGASLMTVIVLPLLSCTLSGKGVAAQFVNVWVIRFSLLIVIIGFVIMWLAQHPVQIGTALLLCGIGEGLEPSLEALASSLVKQASNADLFAIFSVIDTIAKIIGGPLMAAMLSIRNSDGVTMGACFLLSACLFTALWILSWTLSWQKLEEISRHVDEDGE
ncbi:hypothetical protein D6D13_05584 [Aureobasidium pullulans]|uniref:MFS general substrate transporter n=1 Tax=Aureobasidium pullulans TaxID=5580 RepID=A0A4S9CRI5_AURPU|nr:hypothetical protein D6D13_05584 [Aureobasidium pullulans]